MLKICPKCKQEKHYDLFEKKKTGKFGIGSWCKICKSQDRKNYKRSSNYKQTNLNYYYRNKEKWLDIKARRRSYISQPISIFYKEEIRQIYKNCPEGYEVDHIIPLNNEYVCGLHVPWNLQIITQYENRSKGNKFTITM